MNNPCKEIIINYGSILDLNNPNLDLESDLKSLYRSTPWANKSMFNFTDLLKYVSNKYNVKRPYSLAHEYINVWKHLNLIIEQDSLQFSGDRWFMIERDLVKQIIRENLKCPQR